MCEETRDTGRQGTPPGMTKHQAFFLGLRFSLFFGLLSPMDASSLAIESLANREFAQGLCPLSLWPPL